MAEAAARAAGDPLSAPAHVHSVVSSARIARANTGRLSGIGLHVLDSVAASHCASLADWWTRRRHEYRRETRPADCLGHHPDVLPAPSFPEWSGSDPRRSTTEVLVVVDGSRDGSFEYLQQVAEREPRLKPILHRESVGQTLAQQAGVEAELQRQTLLARTIFG